LADMDIEGLNNYIIDRKCPKCHGQIRIMLNDIIQEKIVVCPACHGQIRPINADKIARETKKKLEIATREIQELLKNIKLEMC
jgi:hypothetical protein